MHHADNNLLRFGALVRFVLFMVGLFSVLLVGLALQTRVLSIIESAAVVVGFGVALYIAHVNVCHGKQTAAAYWVGGSALISALLITLVLPQLYTSASVVPLLVATVMLQYAPFQQSRIYLLACGLFAFIVILAGLWLPDSELLPQELTILNTLILLSNVLVALMMIWQFSARLQETLLEVQSTNSVLVSLNHRLERQLHERQRVETALQASERRMAALLNAIPDTLVRLDQQGNVLDVQPTIGYGTDFNELQKSLPPTEVVTTALATRTLQRYEKKFVYGEQLRDYEGRIVVSEDDEVVVIIRDVTSLKVVDRLKSEFISTVSHELRTPLTAIRGSLSLLIGGVAGELSVQARSMLDVAERNCGRLLRLVNDILDIEQLETGKMTMHMHIQPIAPLIEQTIAANRAYAATFDTAIKMIGSDALSSVLIDSDRFVQALTNIVANAVKFSPPHSTVLVCTEETATMVCVSVVDQGPGIPEAFRSRIFQRFAQADGSDTRKAQGSGLGLSITKAIIEQCGGKIDYVTTGSVGTTFQIKLPVATSDTLATS